jgi:formiminoglutamate deiminase
MLESGFTRVGEFHYLHHAPHGVRYCNIAENCSRIVEAAAETGIALTLLPVFYAHSGFGAAAPHAGQARFVCVLDEFARLVESARSMCTAKLDDCVVGVAPHSLRAVAPAQLAHVIALAPAEPIHAHIAEQQAEVDACLAWSGQRPVEWLLDHASVDARWCLVHATHVNALEIGRLARSRAVAGLCPITEADLGDGLFNAPGYFSAGGAFGIGSDSNVLIDAAQELRLLEYGQRLQRQSRNVLAAPTHWSTGRSLFERALSGGAQALGASHGGIEVGAAADIVSLAAANAALLERTGDDILDSWIFSSRSAIDCVWRRGRCLVRNGQHVKREVIALRYAATMRRLFA